MAWYNKYRPVRFDDVVGQDLVKQILIKTVELDNPKHAYLLSGPRGVGKTTLARIFANELNHVPDNSQAALDIVELDAASNTGIDDIRMLRESAQVAPIAGKYKVFIIDEVHMLSKPAMNALLKILEEPPHYLVFLLATTNPEKILPTVLSRLIKLPLASHTAEGLVKRLAYIVKEENVVIEKDALEMIAKRANGSQRDAINTLETISSFGFDVLTPQVVGELLGLVPEVVFDKFAKSLIDFSEIEIKTVIEELNRLNIDPYPFLDQALNYYLEQSVLEGKDRHSIIRAVSQVLDLQYPITTNFQAVSLVVTYYQSMAAKETLLRSEANGAGRGEEKSESEASSQDTLQNKQNAEKKMNNVPTTAKELEKQQVLSTEDAKNNEVFADQLKALQDSERPQSLKMIPDLVIEARNNTVILRTGIGMFLPTLKSDSVKQWVHKYVPTSSIEVEQAASITPAKTSKTKQLSSHKEVVQQQKTSNTETVPESDEVFYTVYNKLPEGSVQNLKVFEGKIPRPVPKNSEKEFEEHADELFEFE